MSLSIDPAVAWAGILLAVPLVIAAAFYGGKWAGRKETQLLLPYASHWCWGIDEDRSFWFPATRVHRRGAAETWADVVGRLTF